MSLINDALKRAKTAHQQASPAAPTGPQLKPVERQPTAPPARGVLMPIAFTAVALVAVFLFWDLHKRASATGATPVRAQSASDRSSSPARVAPLSENEAPKPAANIAASPSAPAPSNTVSEPHSTVSSGKGAEEKTALTITTETNRNTADSAMLSVTTNVPGTNAGNLASSGDSASAVPTPLKLQGVTYDPKRPSAVINGRTLFVGDRIRQMRVTAITADTAILVGAGATNVLTMAE